MSKSIEKAYPILDRLAVATGLMKLSRRRLRDSVIVLMYHKVLPDRLADECLHRKLVIRESTFAGQVSWLARHVRVLPLREALREPPSDRPTVSLTFDDGYRDNAEIAAPLLAGAGLRGTFFVSTGFIEGTPLWFDRAAFAHAHLGPRKAAELSGSEGEGLDLSAFLDHLKRMPPVDRAEVVAAVGRHAPPPPDDLVYGPMSPEQIASLSDTGHEIASHGVNHEMLPDLSPAELDAELTDSADRIREWTGMAPVGFCYPNGHRSPEVEAAVADAGYQYACTTTRGANPKDRRLFRLRRRLISEENSTDAHGRHVDALYAGEVLGVHRTLRRLGL